MEQAEQTKKVSAKKVITIMLDVLLYIFLGLAIVIVALTVMSKVAQKDDPTGASNLFGYEMRYVETGSMEPAYPVNTMIFVEKAPQSYEASVKWFDNVKKGDVLTFFYREAGQRVVITHRVVKITPYTVENFGEKALHMGKEKGGYEIELKGDNNPGGDAVSQYIYTYAHYNEMAEANDQLQGQVIGKVVGQSVVLGAAVTTLKNPLGMVLIIIVPCLIVIIIEVIRIVKVFNSEKNEKAKKQQEEQQEKIDQQSNELELLRQQIALLQQQAGIAPQAPQPAQPELKLDEQKAPVEENSVQEVKSEEQKPDEGKSE